MRDIRSDLEERANLIQAQVKAAYTHFEKVMQQMLGIFMILLITM